MSLAAKLAALTNPEPEFEDPERDDDITAAKVTEHEPDLDDAGYLSVGIEKSKLRIKNADLSADNRYKGKKVSRSKIAKQRGNNFEEGEDDREHASAELGYLFEVGENDDSESQHEDSEESGADDRPDAGSSDGGSEDSFAEDAESGWQVDDGDKEFVFDGDNTDFSQYGDANSDDADSSGEDRNSSQEEEEEEDGEEVHTDDKFDSVEDEYKAPGSSTYLSKDSLFAEVSKGRAVQRQLSVWDKLLEVRILQQKFLSKVNSLPLADYWSALVSDDPLVEQQVRETRQSLTALLKDLMALESVLKGDDQAKEPAQKKMKMTDISRELTDSHDAFKSERNNVIEKWNDKTRITAGKNSFASLETSTVNQIEQIMAGRDRLIDRTKLKRSAYHILGSAEDESAQNDKNMDIFDDDDFYHQLLRELIDRKTNSSSDQAQLTRQWLEVQKLRTKLKKKVDTKASKGRKVRFDIHAKLVNFMAPVYGKPENEETKNELFSSLFGTRR